MNDEKNRDYCKSVVEYVVENNVNIDKQEDAMVEICTQYMNLIVPKAMEPDDVIEPSEAIKYADDLMQLCNRGLLSIIGGVPVCGQQQYPSGNKRFFIYPKEHPKKGMIMNYEDIKRECELCKQSLAQSKKIQGLMKMLTQELNEIREVTLYWCEHPHLDVDLFTAFPTAKFPCAKYLRDVSVDQTCMDEDCEYLKLQKIKLPPRYTEEEIENAS